MVEVRQLSRNLGVWTQLTGFELSSAYWEFPFRSVPVSRPEIYCRDGRVSHSI